MFTQKEDSSSEKNTSSPKQEWFVEWFDSPYYHILYDHRDYDEARVFIQNLSKFLQLNANARVLDLACGNGRHALALHQQGLDVTGIDLSENNIAQAQKLSRDGLQFAVHDMRALYKAHYFNYIFNLFTSFGYFDTLADHQKAIEAMAEGLQPNGYLVMDYLNISVVIQHLKSAEKIEKQGINFTISRQQKNGYIIKNIDIETATHTLHFQERVRAFTQQDFAKMLENFFTIEHYFGNYQLQNFVENTSPRLILVAKRK
ncbi:MAG: class I SAM-dependent methyltransferase [Chitinophagales bacterium]|nr:methyltransferase domain-containing protein [Bacteroidota bacterium]MCB9042218.1 methyltransferase domain-containing protein [Chitinophagales bacterium]